MSDTGIVLAFASTGIDDATFGYPTFTDGWKTLIITGSSQKALRDNKGGRLLLHVKCVGDDNNGGDVGKEHLISLNLWHNDPDTAERAAKELATIMRVMNGGQDWQMNSTAELYNRPFRAMAVTTTQAPTQQYPNPTPQTNWRGYEVASAAGGGNGQMPNFNQQQPNNQQPQSGGGWGNQQPQGGGNPQGGGGNNWGSGNQQQNQPAPQNQPAWGNNGGNTQAPANPGSGAAWNQPQNNPNNQNAPHNQNQQGGWAPQGNGGGGWGS